MSVVLEKSNKTQHDRNQDLLRTTKYMRDEVRSEVVPFRIDIASNSALTPDQVTTLQALEIDAARIAVQAVGSLAKLNEVDHLGGGLDLIPALNLTAALVDYEKIEFTIENAHASIGYYGVLSARGFLDRSDVIEGFRRGLDIPGHVSWVPGGTQLNGGRLGVMIPTATGQALGKKAQYGNGSWVICHCGDAGWISGQALNGFNAADLHGAPVSFVMHRNGIQLSGSNKQIMNKDPRLIIESLGIAIIETPSIHDTASLYKAYQEAYQRAQKGTPSLIYPVGYQPGGKSKEDLNTFGERYGITRETEEFASANSVDMGTEIWTPGTLMSYRNVEAMLECLFLVNELPGGKGHHDGHLKGKDVDAILTNPMLTLSNDQESALNDLRGQRPVTVVTTARPSPGSPNLGLSSSDLSGVSLPGPGKSTSARSGVEAGYAAVAEKYPDKTYVVSCDLDPSTKLGKAKGFLDADHQFELSIEEQVAALVADGLAMSSNDPKLVVFSTFAAFFEGIAREGLEMWRYQRNLNGVNEGLNVTMHMSHVGACTGRDHFSGWSLDWVNLGIGYLPYLHRFYAPADARSAFVAVRDLAAHSGGHIIAIPRDNLPVLEKQDGSGALWDAGTTWEPVTTFRSRAGARKAILAFGAPAYLAGEASDIKNEEGEAVNVHIVNGLPVSGKELGEIIAGYPEGIVTIEDGLIGDELSGPRGFAAIVAGAATKRGIPVGSVGITDPAIAPSDGHHEVWEHFGLTTQALLQQLA